MLNKKGFTSTEVLVTLGIVGVVAMMILPMTNKLKPNRELIMFKKAYHEVNRIVDELIQDDDLYPDKNDPNYSGFANLDEVEYKGKTFSGNSKFCELFATKIGASHPQCELAGYYFYKTRDFSPNFSSPDGMQWGLPAGEIYNTGDFEAGYSDDIVSSYSRVIAVDVNGDKGDNCFEGNNCRTPDRFIILVNRWGKTWVEGDLEKEYINSTSSTKPYKFYKELIEKKKGS